MKKIDNNSRVHECHAPFSYIKPNRLIGDNSSIISSRIHRKIADSQHGFQSNLKMAVFSLWYFANLMRCVLFYHTPLCYDTSVYIWRSGIIKS